MINNDNLNGFQIKLCNISELIYSICMIYNSEWVVVMVEHIVSFIIHIVLPLHNCEKSLRMVKSVKREEVFPCPELDLTYIINTV